METALDRFWSLVSGALLLNPEAFRLINILPDASKAALMLVLLAGLSQAIGQCVVLFINQVKPFRFFVSLLVAAILFVFSFEFWAFSTWLTGNILFKSNLDFSSVARTLSLSYAPPLFDFLGVLPYLGVPILVLLSVWSLLAMVTGLNVLAGLGIWGSFACAGFGWLVFQILQRTIGRPVTAFAQWLSNKVAGTELQRNRQELGNIVMAGNQTSVSDSQPNSNSQPNKLEPNKLESNKLESNKVWMQGKNQKSQIKRFINFRVITFAVFIILILISLITQNWLGVWFSAFSQGIQLFIRFTFISVIALIFSILLTPFEALGWWAGWYGNETIKLGTSVKPVAPQTQIVRYVAYLDGINQGSYKYLPSVEVFLNRLADSLPPNVLVLKGIMPYSPRNKPLKEGFLGYLWRIIDSIALKNSSNPIAFIINIRNIFAVAVSADSRYGAIQNQGLAQVLYKSLLQNGYEVGSGIPITLIGFSGGGQMSMGAVSFLKRFTGAPIELISLAGVISGNTGGMEIEHLYHLVGEQDRVEKVGPIMFPGRWSVFFLSNWNRTKRRGKISFISLGPVGHNGVDGPFSEQEFLSDGRNNLRQTLDMVTGILLKDWTLTGFNPKKLKPSNYELYQQGIFSHCNYYPLNQSVDPELYRPIGTWIGRLILPTQEQRQVAKGVFFEVHHADADYQYLLGKIVILHWSEKPEVQAYVQRVTKSVHFIEQVTASKKQGNIHPDRINHWHHVGPLESLAGARPEDDIIVKLSEPVVVESKNGHFIIRIDREPIQISGRFYGLVSIIQNLGNDLFKVCHYNRTSRNFDGVEETVCIPSVIADRDGVFPSSNRDIENSIFNEKGWYIYGAKNSDDTFVVQAIAPYNLISLSLDEVIFGEQATLDYINHEYWRDPVDNKGQISTVLLYPTVSSTPDFLEQKLDLEIKAINQWEEGDRALVMHVFGGIGGKNPEFAPLGIYFGHFAYGVAKVVREPLSQELCFDIEYRQIYAHNNTGITSGNNSWIRYMGDRQWGFLGYRPISDILVKFSPLTEDYDFDGFKFSPLNHIIDELDAMAARYRIGDGTGTTFVGPVNSCVQDSHEALYQSLSRTVAELKSNPNYVKWLQEHPEDPQTKRFFQLGNLIKSLSAELTPLGIVRPDWEDDRPTLGNLPIENPRETILKTLASWRSLLPRLANDRVAMIFLQLGASLWVHRSNQVGGFNPDIEPFAPTDFGNHIPEIKTPFSRYSS